MSRLNNKAIKVQFLKEKNIDLAKQLEDIKSKQVETLLVSLK